MYIELADSNFEESTKDNTLPVLIDFYAPRCGPCKMLGPTIEEISKELSEKVLVIKVNIDDNPHLKASYNVSKIPTMIFLDKDLNEKETVLGNKPKQEILDKINEILLT